MSNTDTNEEKTKNPMLSQKAYDSLKQAAQYWLPALGVLYAALAALWNFPYAIQVVGTITAVDTFLGVFLGFAKSSYDKSDTKFDGTLNVTQTNDGQFHALQMSPEQYNTLPEKGEVLLKINPADATQVENHTDPRLLS